MTPNEFYEKLSGLKPGVVTLSPGPFRIGLGESDPLAAKLILWIRDELLPEDATIGDALDILDMARWWLIFWHGLELAQETITKHNLVEWGGNGET